MQSNAEGDLVAQPGFGRIDGLLEDYIRRARYRFRDGDAELVASLHRHVGGGNEGGVAALVARFAILVDVETPCDGHRLSETA